MTPPQLRYAARTHVGRRRRINEDSILPMPDIGVFALADGMGGHDGGDLASQTVIARIAAVPPGLDAGALLRAVRSAILSAHQEIAAEARGRGGMMGTTVVALILTEGHFACLWAGDSRLYLCRAGHVEQLTGDHSLVAEMVRNGQLAPEEADSHPRGNVITRAVGVGDALELDKIRGTILPGDRFLLCSDGLTRYAGSGELTRFLSGRPIENVADDLIDFALERGGEDNVSVIVVEIA
ncbi:MAG: serine/threonine phosphatase [Paracoccaceae bacterium]|nr:MAG: serine/threonine phosphatase [Paracoccaceae bacterium]